MTIWARIGDFVQAIGVGGSDLIDRALTPFFGDEAHRRAVAFTIAIVALSAKMARADGVVVAAEIQAFRDHFAVPPGEEANVERLFQLAQQDVAGFEHYAAKIKALFADDPATLEDVLDVLFVIAGSDGLIHAREIAYLERVAQIFGLPTCACARIRARHVMAAPDDPYLILGVDPGADDATLRAEYRRLVREHHPDRVTARGVPQELVKLATERLAAINVAWGRIAKERGL